MNCRSSSRMALLILCAALAGCAVQRIRDASESQLREGRYEQAVKVLEDGLIAHPGEPQLRSALMQARNEALLRSKI